MGKAILGAFLAAIAMFGWGYLAWSPVLDLHEVRSLKESQAITETLQQSADETGVYWIPAVPEEKDVESEPWKEFEKKLAAGPRAMVVYRTDGAKWMDPLDMAKGFGLQFLACLLLAFLILGSGIRTFFGRVIFVATIGLVLVILSDGMNWVFFHFPDEWTMWQAIDHAAAVAIAGLVLAYFVRPKTA